MGPMGFAAGIVFWLLGNRFSWSANTERQVMRLGCGLIVFSVIVVAFAPHPNWIGRLYEVEFVSCRAVATETENVIANWQKRIESVSSLLPRQGWQDETKNMLRDEPGSILEANILSEKNVKKEKSFLKEEKFVAYAITYNGSHRSSFYIAQSCMQLPVDNRSSYFVPADIMHLVPDKSRPWPPTVIGDLLVKATLLQVPEYLRLL